VSWRTRQSTLLGINNRLTKRWRGPEHYLTFGISGKFNHLVGVRGAGTVVAVNTDPQAWVFEALVRLGHEIGASGRGIDVRAAQACCQRGG
jgi:hypothetical protein